MKTKNDNKDHRLDGVDVDDARNYPRSTYYSIASDLVDDLRELRQMTEEDKMRYSKSYRGKPLNANRKR
jgi:hypothetical protein